MHSSSRSSARCAAVMRSTWASSASGPTTTPRRSPRVSTTGVTTRPSPSFAPRLAARSDRRPAAAQRAGLALGGQRPGQGTGIALRHQVPHRRGVLPPDGLADRDDVGPPRPRQRRERHGPLGAGVPPGPGRLPTQPVRDRRADPRHRGRRGARRVRVARAGGPPGHVRPGAGRPHRAPRPDAPRRSAQHVGPAAACGVGAVLRRRRPLSPPPGAARSTGPGPGRATATPWAHRGAPRRGPAEGQIAGTSLRRNASRPTTTSRSPTAETRTNAVPSNAVGGQHRQVVQGRDRPDGFGQVEQVAEQPDDDHHRQAQPRDRSSLRRAVRRTRCSRR